MTNVGTTDLGTEGGCVQDSSLHGHEEFWKILNALNEADPIYSSNKSEKQLSNNKIGRCMKGCRE